MTPFSFRYQPVLGTELHILVGCGSVESAERAQQRVIEEILRLDALLSTYRPETPLSRWVRGETEELPDEVCAVLVLAHDWFEASSGAFHPGLGGLRARWRQAEQQGHLPNPSECVELVAQAAQLPYTVRTSVGSTWVERRGDCSSLDLDALAKGWIVDRAAETGMSPEVDWVLVNVGGDLRLAGPGSARVAIEDPASSVDNLPPLGVVTMSSGGLASSGPARRGFRIADQWYGHVLDPRTGWPVDRSAGVTVIAPDTATADVLTTVVGVTGLDQPAVVDLLADRGAAALEVTAAGAVQPSRRWREQVVFVLRPTG